jgi:hypothetical protein
MQNLLLSFKGSIISCYLFFTLDVGVLTFVDVDEPKIRDKKLCLFFGTVVLDVLPAEVFPEETKLVTLSQPFNNKTPTAIKINVFDVFILLPLLYFSQTSKAFIHKTH